MHCARASRLIQLYIDHQLSLDEVRALEQHLSGCTTCRGELLIFEEIVRSLGNNDLVPEPINLTTSIMRRVAWSTRALQEEKAQRQEALKAYRPSLLELLAAICLATFAMLGAILSEPSLRSALPIANGHDGVSLFCIRVWNDLLSLNSSTLMLGFWVIGTILGIWITLIVAGSEVRGNWIRAVINRFPVW